MLTFRIIHVEIGIVLPARRTGLWQAGMSIFEAGTMGVGSGAGLDSGTVLSCDIYFAM